MDVERTLQQAVDHHRAGRFAAALRAYENVLAAEPDNSLAGHMRAAISGDNVPAKADAGYVRRLFDWFADDFDARLAALHYRVPKLVAERLCEIYGQPRAQLEVLDAGCGTGLTGIVLRPYAAALTGVDLSPEMLRLARSRGIYDELCEAELEDYLGHSVRSYDLVVCGDVLVYFGDLRGVFSLVMAALRPGGAFCFTLEKTDGSRAARDYELGPQGRYRHHAASVRQMLDGAGFATVRMEDCIIRLESDQPTAGMIVTAGRVD